MKLETLPVTIQKSKDDVFKLLSDLKNFEQLMPNNIQKFEVDRESFLFALPSMPEIRLVLKEKKPTKSIVLGAASSKLDFTLLVDLKELSEKTTTAQLFFEGKFNPMMAMLVKKPLTNFINTLSFNLQKI